MCVGLSATTAAIKFPQALRFCDAVTLVIWGSAETGVRPIVQCKRFASRQESVLDGRIQRANQTPCHNQRQQITIFQPLCLFSPIPSTNIFINGKINYKKTCNFVNGHSWRSHANMYSWRTEETKKKNVVYVK